MELGYRFENLTPVGSGVVSDVYSARDLKTGKTVALKLFAEHILDRDTAIRIGEHIEAARNLNHPNVEQVYEYVMSAIRPYIVAEFVEGRDLHDLASDDHVQLQLRQILRIAADVVEGLRALHDRHIIHGDLLPNNILITPSGTARIVEVGLYPALKTTLFKPAGPVESDAARWMVAHCAPELLLGNSVGPRADQFALGTVLYELCARKPAFLARDVVETRTAVLGREPIPLHLADPSVPAEFGRIVEQLMQKDPAARFASMRELSHHLRRLEARLSPRVSSRTGLQDQLRDTFDSSDAEARWLRTPNRLLDGARPIDLMDRHEFARVSAALEALNTGVFV